MSIIATAVRHLLAAGVTGEALCEAIADLEAAQPKDAAAERRREWDRNRKRRQREEAVSGGIPVDSAEIADTPLSPAPNENNSNPHPHTPVDITTRARDDFPKPDWCDPQVWRDLKSNRKAKRLPCTPTAHAKLLRDIDKLVDDEWPPGRLIEAIVARGWAAAYDPRDERTPANGQHSRIPKPTTRDIGERVAARYASANDGAADGLHRLGSSGGYG